jgi:hypothetical protein
VLLIRNDKGTINASHSNFQYYVKMSKIHITVVRSLFVRPGNLVRIIPSMPANLNDILYIGSCSKMRSRNLARKIENTVLPVKAIEDFQGRSGKYRFYSIFNKLNKSFTGPFC